MDTIALATVASAEPLLIALIVALATGGPSLIFAIYRWRKTAPREADDLVSRAAQQAVEMMDVTLKAAANERTELLEKLAEQNGLLVKQNERIERLERRVEQLEKAWPSGYPLPAPA